MVALVALWATSRVRTKALSQGILDVPNERSSHVVTTPRGGGLAIVWVFCGASLLLAGTGVLPWGWLALVLPASALVALIGWIDDVRQLSAKIRLLVQVFSAFLSCVITMSLYSGGLFLELAPLSVMVLALLVIICMVALTNFYNFMDGIDGLAATEAVMVALFAGMLMWWQGHTSFATWMWMLSGAVAGFLYWNWMPAKIFLGDVGSGFLGFVFAALVLLSSSLGVLSPWVWLILLGFFIVDAGVTLGRRFLRGACWYEAHCSHAYQNLSRRLGSHGYVVVVAIIVNLFWLFPWAVMALIFDGYGLVYSVIALLPLVVVALIFDAGIEGS